MSGERNDLVRHTVSYHIIIRSDNLLLPHVTD
jgi:hypothetical protein